MIDAEAAAKAKLRAVGLLCGGWDESDLRQASCIAIYHNPADLLAHYQNSPIGGVAGTEGTQRAMDSETTFELKLR